MASIDRRQDGHYRARWREYPGGRQKTKQFLRKKEAELFLDAVRGDLAHGRYVDPAGGLISFREYAEQWRLGQVHRPSTAAQTESYLRLHAYPFLGHRPLGSIRRSEVQAWVKGRSEVLSPGSLEVVYRWAGHLQSGRQRPAHRGVTMQPHCLPKHEDGEVVPLTAAQVQEKADACPDRYRALVVLAAGTGLRQGECFGLSVDRIDFLHRQVRVNRQLIGAKAGVPEFGPPKNKAGFRTVPLPDVVSTALAEHLARYRRCSSDLIFISSYGTPLRRNTAGEMWHRAAQNAELPSGRRSTTSGT
jgi:integrase